MGEKSKKVAIIGAGLQARRRIPAILQDLNYEIVWIVDLQEERARQLSTQCGAQYGIQWQQAVKDQKVDIVMVLTYPNSHAEISNAAMKNGKDVLCEKPLARTEQEALTMIQTAKKTKRILKCGFNHRHHPAIARAYALFQQNLIGKALFGRGKYGIAGREGLEKEWRSDPKIVSGGQLMEQGIHLIDLFRWFLGEIETVTGFVNAGFWPIAPLEDNAFALLKMEKGVVASIHSSLTQWINTFEFEIYGENGSLTVQGLGGSYGDEKLSISLRDPYGPFRHETIEFRSADISWQSEWREFTKAVETRKISIGDAVAGLRAQEIVRAIYTSSKTGNSIKIK